MTLHFKPKGFLLPAAMIILVLVSGLVAVGADLLTSHLENGINQLNSKQAFYIAEGGLARARYELQHASVETALNCSSIRGSNAFTRIPFGRGEFTVVGSSHFTKTTTVGNLDEGTTDSLRIEDSANFPPSGRAIIGGEVIHYSGVGSGSLTCGEALSHCLYGLTRGISGSIATHHPSGTIVSQYECHLQSSGGVPNLSAPQGKRVLEQIVEMNEAWAVGFEGGNYYAFVRYNGPQQNRAWENHLVPDSTHRARLYGVSMVNRVFGWAVGQARHGQLNILHWNGIQWIRQTPPAAPNVDNTPFDKDLLDVQAVSNLEAWAVGERSDKIKNDQSGPSSGLEYRYNILRWNNQTQQWCILDLSGTNCGGYRTPDNPQYPADIQALSLVDTNDDGLADTGFAVTKDLLLAYQRPQWSEQPSTVIHSDDLLDIKTVQPKVGLSAIQDAWIVASGGSIYHYNGSQWASQPRISHRQLNGIDMLDTNRDGLGDEGWAVGQHGTAIHIMRHSNGTYQLTLAPTPTNQALRAVHMNTVHDVWVVGNHGMILHWDGHAWYEANSPTNKGLYDIDFIENKGVGDWREVFF